MKKKNRNQILISVIRELEKMEFGDEIRIKNTESGYEFYSSKSIKQFRERKIYKLLQKLAIPFDFKGYSYIKEAVMYCLEEENKAAIYKEVYAAVAKKFETSRANVERNIRTAKEYALKRGTYCKEIFGNMEGGKITNKEFIYFIVEKIKAEEKSL